MFSLCRGWSNEQVLQDRCYEQPKHLGASASPWRSVAAPTDLRHSKEKGPKAEDSLLAPHATFQRNRDKKVSGVCQALFPDKSGQHGQSPQLLDMTHPHQRHNAAGTTNDKHANAKKQSHHSRRDQTVAHFHAVCYCADIAIIARLAATTTLTARRSPVTGHPPETRPSRRLRGVGPFHEHATDEGRLIASIGGSFTTLIVDACQTLD